MVVVAQLSHMYKKAKGRKGLPGIEGGKEGRKKKKEKERKVDKSVISPDEATSSHKEGGSGKEGFRTFRIHYRCNVHSYSSLLT